MAMKRGHKKKDDSGVSEVVGSILTLSITVILFTSIFWGVQTLEPPVSQRHTTFSVSLEEQHPEGTVEFYLNVTNIGGEPLVDRYTSIRLLLNHTDSYSFTFEDDADGQDLLDGWWDIGNTLNLYFDDENPEERYSEVWGTLRTPDSHVELIIYDNAENQVVLAEIIKDDTVYEPIIRKVGVDYPLPWETYTVPGEGVTLWADILDKSNPIVSSINTTVDLEPLDGFDGEAQMYPVTDRPREVNRFSLYIELSEEQNNGTFLLEVNLEGSRDVYYIVLHVGEHTVSPFDPHLHVEPDRIHFDPISPSAGDLFVTKVTIYNSGGASTVADVYFYDKHPDGTEYEVDVKEGVRFAAGGGMDLSTSWNINRSGIHNITIVAEYNDEEASGYKHVNVFPSILLVDDEGTPDGSVGSDTKAMKDALASTDFSYDHVRATPGFSGLFYDQGTFPLENYDVVVWMFGSRDSNTLVQEDRDELEEFLENDRRLWLIGDGIADDANTAGWIGWLNEWLHTDVDSLSNAPAGPLEGANDPVMDGEEFYIREPEAGKHGDYLTPYNQGNSVLLDTGDAEDKPVAVSFNSTEEGGRRTLFQSIRFDSIDESTDGHRSHLTYHVILWLGNVEGMIGRDLAVTSQEFTTRFPTYRDTIEISATVRNNGPQVEYPEVVLMMNGDVVDEQDIRPIGSGQREKYLFEWIAEPVGVHELKVVVDPNNRIPETNTENNDITYQGVNVTVRVLFDTLIVDDTNGGESVEMLENMYEALEYPYEIYEVEDGEDGPSALNMSSYNSVIWVTGQKQSNTLTINDMKNITDYLYNYTGYNNFVFFGDHLLEDISGQTSGPAQYFFSEVLHIDRTTVSSVMAPSKLEGTFDDPVTHGSRYRLDGNWLSQPYSYDTLDDAETILREGGDIFAHRVSKPGFNLVFNSFDLARFDPPISPEEIHWYDMVGFNTSAQSARTEYIYMMNKWFGIEDGRIELRVSEVDIITPDEYPMLGRAFIITVRIQNLGDIGSNALVRFRDGTSHIDTESAYVPPGGFADVEVKWQPLHAGPERPIRVIVDPLHEVPEVPNQPGQQTEEDLLSFNNQAIHYTPVYYFWDDMETGAEKWSHEAQIAYISGETAIDYMGGQYESLDTNVAGDWDYTDNLTHGIEKVTEHAHSDPYSYFMEEPEGPIGLRADAIVSMVIDNSFSMGDREVYDEESGEYISWLEKAKSAASFLVTLLSNESRVGVWAYQGTNPRQIISPPMQLENNRDYVLEQIDGIESNPQAPVYDTVGNAYLDVIGMADDYPELVPAVIGLTDGADKMAADPAAEPPQFELGSQNWAPWHEMENEDGTPIINYGDSHIGKYRFDYRQDPDPYEPGVWSHVGDQDQGPGNRRGLLNSSIQIFTIGLGLEHNTDLDVNPENPDWNPAPDLESAGDENFLIEKDPNDERTWEAGTTEYNLWRIANTSDAEYFYAPGPDDLEDIFDLIARHLIGGAQNLTSMDPPVDIQGNGLMEEEEDEPVNVDKMAVTPAFDLTGTDEAWLTFWHRYKLIQGVNGAYLQIGYEDPDDGELMWRYVKPSVGPYSGNLLQHDDITLPVDSFGQEINWCWNGKSAGGTLNWEFVRVDLLRQMNDLQDEFDIPDEALESVRVRFYYKQYGGGVTPGGWWIDDVGIVVTREGDVDDSGPDMHDVWQRVLTQGRDGDTTWAWRNMDPETGWFRSGIDNRLVTVPIDLRNALTANLTADFKFNINTAGGRPPDGFRVEVSTNNGLRWSAINLGVRSASGVSGYEEDNYWVKAGELSRLNVDLSDFSGNVILLRFRVVTCGANAYDHFEDGTLDFGGFFINNVMVYGQTIHH